MRSIAAACAAPDFPARIALVLSNRPDAAGLDYARRAGFVTAAVDHKLFPDKKSFETAIRDVLKDYTIDLICLAGFMRILSADFIAAHPPDSIINIHPSLLPAYKGLDTHARVLADGAPETGCTVHYVVPELDAGPIILQKKVTVLPCDTPSSLAEKVLEKEHEAYPEAIRIIAAEKSKNRRVAG